MFFMGEDFNALVSQGIRSQLKKKEKTQSWLAKEMGREEGYISELLNCKDDKRWNSTIIDEAIKALNIPAWHLFADPEKVYPANHQLIVKAYLSLPEGMREAVDMIMFPERIQENQTKDQKTPQELRA